VVIVLSADHKAKKQLLQYNRAHKLVGVLKEENEDKIERNKRKKKRKGGKEKNRKRKRRKIREREEKRRLETFSTIVFNSDIHSETVHACILNCPNL
jgi:hypothetical protein